MVHSRASLYGDKKKWSLQFTIHLQKSYASCDASFTSEILHRHETECFSAWNHVIKDQKTLDSQYILLKYAFFFTFYYYYYLFNPFTPYSSE